MYDSTNFPSPIYDDTSHAVYRIMGQFVVHNVLDDPDGVSFFLCGNSLRHALEYADNGELSPGALRVLATYQA